MKNLVSIIIPTYNVEKYVATCIDSIISQSYSNIQIICVDDNSTDNTKNIIQKYINAGHPIQLLTNSLNRGPSYSRNKGLKIASGDYISFVDGDDILHKDLINNLVDCIKATNADIVVGSDVWFNDNDSYHININLTDNSNRIISTHNILYFNIPVVAWCKLYKRSFLVENNLLFHSNILHEDEVWSMETVYSAQNIAIRKNAIYFYRQRSGSRQDERNNISLNYAIKYLDTVYLLLKINRESNNLLFKEKRQQNLLHFIQMIYWVLKKVKRSNLNKHEKILIAEKYYKFTTNSFGYCNIIHVLTNFLLNGNNSICVMKFKVYRLIKSLLND